ncbi:MAG TPA: glycoside hydrolase family 9 protein [Ruminococcus sp.]|nr:glycoside hydrolase family 9 protein [Ruminococcus sp.]
MSLRSKFKKTITGLLSTAIVASAIPAAASAPVTNAAGDPNYAEALALSLYFFDANACGENITGGPLTWRENCHTYDSQADLDKSEGLSSSEKAAIKAANGGSSIIDASGGYHDAGDHIKFSMTIGFAITSVAWSYFSYPDAFEKAECTGHLKYILRNACDYFMKTTFLDDSGNVIAYVDQIASEGEDHSIWTAPETQTMNRTVYWSSPSNPIADSAGEMAAALASSSLAFKESDPEYAAECLKYGKALAKFADKNTSYNAKGRGGMYDGSGSLKDDVVWGQLWCDVAENGGKLPAGYTPPATLTGDKSYSTGEYDGWLYCWNKVYSGYAALLGELGYDGDKYTHEAKIEVEGTGGSKFSTSEYAANWGWGSARYNCALQGIAWRTGDANLEAAAKHQMDYILNSSTQYKSYFVGYGDSYPTHYHHRASNPGNGNPADNTSAKYILYGALLGGPDSSGGYEDHQNSYSCTEPALDYNGCFVLACAPLVSKYGGDASAVKALEKSAPEINENYEFKENANIVTTTTTTQTTTTTTTTSSTPVTTIVNVKDAVVLEYNNGFITLQGDPGDGLTKIYADRSTTMYIFPETYVGDTVNGHYSYVLPDPNNDGKTEYTNVTELILQPVVVWGDADLDGNVKMNDAVLIMQSISNGDRFGLTGSEDTHITQRGQRNADVTDSHDGISPKDALRIQEFLLKKITDLTPVWVVESNNNT